MKTLKLCVLGLSALMISACQHAVVLHPHGPIGAHEKNLIIWSTLLMLVVVVPVIVMTIVFAWKYRASNPAADYQPDWSHSRKIEYWIWLIPCIIIAILATISWKTTHQLDPYQPLASKEKPLTIQVIALNWKWLFIYPEQHIATINYLIFPVNVPVHFKISCDDTAINSFFIPQLGSQIYAMAGMQTQLYLLADQPGHYDGMSANFSGRGFWNMHFIATATSQTAFQAWVKKIKASNTHLNTYTYSELKHDSVMQHTQSYGSVSSHLYETIVRSFMMPMKHHLSHHPKPYPPKILSHASSSH